MNIFRFCGDMCHLFSILVLLLKIYATKSCSGKPTFLSITCISSFPRVLPGLKINLPPKVTPVVYDRDLAEDAGAVVFIGSSVAIVCCMRWHHAVKRSYDRDLDTFKYQFLVLACFLLALVLHEKFTFLEDKLFRAIYNDNDEEGFNVFCTNKPLFWVGQKISMQCITRAYRALYILNWIYRYLTQPHFNGWISCFSGLIQTALYADFFYYYFISWKSNSKLQLPA
uniref:EXS domain-containing protein n=1 Tax=Lactuca sativa TaxID=4236 RepID=A0A9R1WSM4_LACSA|nr:hypothetical protein LSAT_V11C100043840 [Lactuca sativa]